LTAWLFGKYSLKGKLQVEALLHYVIDEPPENADNKQAFKFPFIACEIFTCEIDVILKTLVEDEELMSLLFLFLEPDRPHGTLLAGYFSKVFVNFSQISDNTTLMNIMIGYFICAWLVVLLIGLKLPYSHAVVFTASSIFVDYIFKEWFRGRFAQLIIVCCIFLLG
jgi:hypothetical protein